MDYIRENISFIIAIFGGVIISTITSQDHSIKQSIVRVACGVFCGVFFTEPLIHWLSLEKEVYTNATAGLLAITGHGIAKTFTRFSLQDLQSIIKILRGNLK